MIKLLVKHSFRLKLEFWFWLGCFFDQQVKKFDQKRQLAAEANFDKFLSKSEKWHQKKGLNIRFIAKMTLIVCKLQRLSKMYVQTLLILCCQEFFVVLKYIRFKRKSGVSTGSTFSALTVKREIQKKTAFDPGTPLLFQSTQFQLDFRCTMYNFWLISN